MSSHENIAVGLQDMTRAGLIRMIEQLVKGKRGPGDAERDAEEAEKKSRLHEEHKGKSPSPPVTRDDVGYGPDEEDDTEGDEEKPEAPKKPPMKAMKKSDCGDEGGECD